MMEKKESSLIIVFVCLVLLSMSGFGWASEAIYLTNGNSEIKLYSDDYMTNWLVDGTDHLWRHHYFYRTGDDPSESAIYTIGDPVEIYTGSTLAQYYSTDVFNLAISYTITGGEEGSNSSSLNESLYITNRSDEVLTISLFSLFDYDLTGYYKYESASISDDGSQVTQWDENTVMLQTLSEHPTAWAIAGNGENTSLHKDLIDDAITILDSALNESLNETDMCYALQWDLLLESGESFQLTTITSINPVPVPGSILLLGSGLLGLVGVKRRESSNA